MSQKKIIIANWKMNPLTRKDAETLSSHVAKGIPFGLKIEVVLCPPFLYLEQVKKIFKKIAPAHFWHSLSRLIGVSFLEERIETVLFLDADEVPEGQKFAEWLDCSDYRPSTALKLANYWYFRSPAHQALKFEDSIVLAQRRSLESDILLHRDERDAIYNLLPGPKRRHVVGSDGKPMFHHYSWVRTQDEMLRKVRTWGHRGERDWEALVQREFANPFSGTDYIHGYSYREVPPLFGLSLSEPSFASRGVPNVKRLRRDELLNFVKKDFRNLLFRLFPWHHEGI